MARVEHASRGFEREREKESSRHERGKKDVREDRPEDARDEGPGSAGAPCYSPGAPAACVGALTRR